MHIHLPFTKNYVFNYNIFKNIRCSEKSLLDSHILDLVTIIYKEYLKISLHFVTKTKIPQLLVDKKKFS